MSLLKIKTSKKITAICSFEESTSLLLDQYKAYLKIEEGEEVSGDAIVDAAVLHAFARDKKFQHYLETHQGEKAAPALKVKVPIKVAVKAKGGSKQPIAIAQ